MGQDNKAKKQAVKVADSDGRKDVRPQRLGALPRGQQALLVVPKEFRDLNVPRGVITRDIGRAKTSRTQRLRCSVVCACVCACVRVRV